MIQLKKMTEAEFQAFLQHSIDGYVEDVLASGQCAAREDAVRRAEEEVFALIPGGRYDPALDLYTAVNEAGEAVGIVWFTIMPEKKILFIAEFEVAPEHRRKGYGRAILMCLEPMARARGCERMLLHVFEHNTAARALYEGLGYRVAHQENGSIHMAKTI